MSVVSLKSLQITNRDASPALLSNASYARSNLKESEGYVTAGSADSIGSKYILCSLPSNARVSQLLLSCGAITSAAADFGVYKDTKDGGAVVDADFFASAQSIATALSNSDITNESGVFTIAKQEMPLWQALGLSADPLTNYDICATLTAASTASADLGLKVRYAE